MTYLFIERSDGAPSTRKRVVPNPYRANLLSVVAEYAPLYFRYFDTNSRPSAFIPLNDPTVFLYLPIKHLKLGNFRDLNPTPSHVVHSLNEHCAPSYENALMLSHYEFKFCEYEVSVHLSSGKLIIQFHNLKFVLIQSEEKVLSFQLYFMEKLTFQLWEALREISLLEVFYYYNSKE